MAEIIGSLRVLLSADTAAFTTGMKRAEGQADRSATAIRNSLSAVKTAVLGFAAGLSAAALVDVARRALDYASSLGEVSQQLGVTTRDLQIFRYAASQTGISQEQMDKALGKLTVTLGQVAAGAKAPTEALKAIGVSADELAGKDTGEALRIIAEGLSRVPDRAQRAAVEVALFGRAGAALDTLLAGGRSAIDELSRAAETLGIVLSDEQIQKADETADKLAAVKMVLEANIAGVVSDNAGAILELANAFAQVVAWAGKAVTAWKQFSLESRARQLQNKADGLFASPQERMTALQEIQSIRDEQFRLAGGGASGTPQPTPKPTEGGITRFLSGGGGGKGKSAEQLAREAERQREAQIRQQYNVTQDALRAQEDELRARQAITHDIRERGVLEERLLELDHQAEQAQIDFDLAMGDITDEQAEKRRALASTVHALHQERAAQDEAYDLVQEQIRQRREIESQVIESAELEASLTRTAAQRREVEMRILDLRLEQQRQALRDVLEDDRSSVEEKNAAGRGLLSLERNEGSMREQVRRGTMGPLESYLDSLPRTADEAREALEAVATQGLGSIIDGLADAATGARSLGDVFKNVSNQIVSELIRIQLQKAIVGGLSNALGGLFGGGINMGSFAGTVASNSAALSSGLGTLPRLAGGGTIQVGGLSGVDTNLLSINGQPTAWVNKGENLAVTPANDAGPSRVVIVPTPYFDAVVEGRAAAVAAPMAGRAAVVGSADARRRISYRQDRQFP